MDGNVNQMLHLTPLSPAFTVACTDEINIKSVSHKLRNACDCNGPNLNTQNGVKMSGPAY